MGCELRCIDSIRVRVKLASVRQRIIAAALRRLRPVPSGLLDVTLQVWSLSLGPCVVAAATLLFDQKDIADYTY